MPQSEAQTWRVVPMKRAKGRYFVLQKGRGHDRVSITLGYVAEDAADRALKRVQEEQDLGSVGRVARLFSRHRKDAIKYLCGDRIVEKLVGPKAVDYGGMTLQQYFDSGYSAWRAQKRPPSWVQEERRWERILEDIGNTRLRRMDEFVLADHLDQAIVTRGKRLGEPLSGNGKRLRRAAVQAMVKRAYRLKHIERMPNLGMFQIEGATKLVQEKPDPLTLIELAALMHVSDPKWRAMWATGAGQGLRPSELTRIQWPDVRFSEELLDVRGEKTDLAAETIPLTPLAFRELRRWWVACGQPDSGLVFPSQYKGLPYTESGYREALKSAAVRARVKRRIYPYLLRDSFATIAWSLEIDIDVARRVMRHTNDKMIREVYCRPRPADLVKAVQAFDFADGGQPPA
jgi:integrase